MHEIGSRGYQIIDYKNSAIISGVSYDNPLYSFKPNHIIIRSDLVNFCYEFLSYKMGLNETGCNIVCNWTFDQERYPTRVYRQSLSEDFITTSKILNNFYNNFKSSEIKKVQY